MFFQVGMGHSVSDRSSSDQIRRKFVCIVRVCSCGQARTDPDGGDRLQMAAERDITWNGWNYWKESDSRSTWTQRKRREQFCRATTVTFRAGISLPYHRQIFATKDY